jgi:hypothetical protein
MRLFAPGILDNTLIYAARLEASAWRYRRPNTFFLASF